MCWSIAPHELPLLCELILEMELRETWKWRCTGTANGEVNRMDMSWARFALTVLTGGIVSSLTDWLFMGDFLYRRYTLLRGLTGSNPPSAKEQRVAA